MQHTVYGKCEEDINASQGGKNTVTDHQYAVPGQEEPVYREIVAEPRHDVSFKADESIYYVPEQNNPERPKESVETNNQQNANKEYPVEETEYHTPEPNKLKNVYEHEDEQTYSGGYSAPDKSPLNPNDEEEVDECDYYSTPVSNENDP